MSVKLRNSNGTFATPTTINQEESTISENVIVQHRPRPNISLIIKIVLGLIVLMPWISIVLRRKNVELISQKIVDFYDDNFSCNSYCNSLLSKSEIKKDDLVVEKDRKTNNSF